MAVKFGSVRGPQVLSLYLIGMIAIFVGERLIQGETTTRWVVSGLGLLATVVACLSYLVAWFGSTDMARRVERLAFAFSLLGLLAIALYILSTDLVLGPKPVTKTAEEALSLRQLLEVAWLVTLVCAVLPLLFIQWSLSSMAQGRGVEYQRVQTSTTAALSLAMLLCILFFVNAIVKKKDVFSDLSYFKTTSPSDSTKEMIAGLDREVEALLFFPHANEVLAEIESYFDELASESDKFRFRQIDRAMEPKLAEKYRVSKEGTVVLVRGSSNKKLEIADNLDSAKRKLKKLDQEFQNTFLALSFDKETIYLVTGHGERTQSQVEGDNRPRIKTLRSRLEAANFTVKQLDAVSGLSNEIPQDAAMLLWMGPMAPMFPGSQKTITDYLDRGGRMLLTLDPESEHQPQDVLQYLGLTFEPNMVVGPYYIKVKRNSSDVYNLVTNQFSSHAASSNVSRYSRELPVVMPTVGHFEKAKSATKNRITFLVRSLPKSYVDKDGNFERSDQEKFGVYQLAAAVSRKVKDDSNKTIAKEAKSTDKKESSEEKEMRVAVFADADVFADTFYGFKGNSLLLADIMGWLMDSKRVGGATQSEEDIPIQHTQREDVIWFYGTVFAVPLLILGFGVITRWGRGRKQRASS